jgi:hypothetical protein
MIIPTTTHYSCGHSKTANIISSTITTPQDYFSEGVCPVCRYEQIRKNAIEGAKKQTLIALADYFNRRK